MTGCVRNTIHGCCVANKTTKNLIASQMLEERRAREHNVSRNELGHGQSSEASAFPRAHTTGFNPVYQYQPDERTHASDTYCSRGSRHELSHPSSHHYQTSNSSTATNFHSPYGQIGNNDGRLISNQAAYNPATFGGGYTNTGPPLQSLGNPYSAPRPNNAYQAGGSDRQGGRRSTRPPQTSGNSSRAPGSKGP